MEAAVIAAGHAEAIAWSDSLRLPEDADHFATEAIFVICSSGMSAAAAETVFQRVMLAVKAGQPAATAFRHRQKAAAIDQIWCDRADLFAAFNADDDKLAFCAELPFIGAVTRWHLAKNLGLDVAKPDVHLERLAQREGVTPQALCLRIAEQAGRRVATVDTILWRACAEGIITPARYLKSGWRAGVIRLPAKGGISADVRTKP